MIKKSIKKNMVITEDKTPYNFYKNKKMLETRKNLKKIKKFQVM